MKYKHIDEMGVKGAFTSAGFDTSSIKRFGDRRRISPSTMVSRSGCHANAGHHFRQVRIELQNIFDLYINDATIPKTQLASAMDANSEFALGEAVFLQNGSWG